MSDLSKLCLGCMREKPDYEPVKYVTQLVCMRYFC